MNSDTQGVEVDEEYVYSGPHLSEYDRTKALAHAIALQEIEQGLPLVVAMPGVIYGPDDYSSIGNLIRRYLKRKVPMLPAKPAYNWAHVDDVAGAHLLCMDRGALGEKYIVCGQRCGMVEAFTMMEEICGVPKPKRIAGPGLLRLLAGFMQAFQWMRLPPDYQPETLRVAANATYLGNNAKAKRELGFAPRPLREGLEQTLRYEMAKLGLEFGLRIDRRLSDSLRWLCHAVFSLLTLHVCVPWDVLRSGPRWPSLGECQLPWRPRSAAIRIQDVIWVDRGTTQLVLTSSAISTVTACAISL